MLSLDQGSQALLTGPGAPPAPGWGLEGAPSQSPQHVGAAGRARAAIWTPSVLLGPSVCPDSPRGWVSAWLGLCLSSLLFLDSCNSRQSGGGRCLSHLASGPEQVCPRSLTSIYYRHRSADFLLSEANCWAFQVSGKVSRCPSSWLLEANRQVLSKNFCCRWRSACEQQRC